MGTAGAFSLRDSVASATSKTLGPGWTNAKWGGPPGPRPTHTSACCWYLSVLEVATGPGGPARTRGSAPPLAEVFSPLDGLQAHEIHSCERMGFRCEVRARDSLRREARILPCLEQGNLGRSQWRIRRRG